MATLCEIVRIWAAFTMGWLAGRHMIGTAAEVLVELQPAARLVTIAVAGLLPGTLLVFAAVVVGILPDGTDTQINVEAPAAGACLPSSYKRKAFSGPSKIALKNVIFKQTPEKAAG